MADLKTSQETVKTPIVGDEMIRLATTGANWRTTVDALKAYMVGGTVTGPLIIGGATASSKVTIQSTSITSGATSDAVEIKVGNNGEFHGMWFGHKARTFGTGQSMYCVIGGDDTTPFGTLAKLNVFGGGHYDLEGATICCQNDDPLHCSIHFISTATNVSPGGPEGNSYKGYNVGLNGPEWGDLTGMFFIFDHDYFVHRMLISQLGDVYLGNNAGENPAVVITHADAPAHPVTRATGLLTTDVALAIGDESQGVYIGKATTGLWSFTFPSGPGSNGQKLTTDGSGNCFWS